MVNRDEQNEKFSGRDGMETASYAAFAEVPRPFASAEMSGSASLPFKFF
jgi:hypothetical protein